MLAKFTTHIHSQGIGQSVGDSVGASGVVVATILIHENNFLNTTIEYISMITSILQTELLILTVP